MKRNGLIMMALIASCTSMTLLAQENLDALIKKCEALPSIDMSVTRTRNAQTKELEREIISFTIHDNPDLVNEFLTVFKKDEVNAITVNETKQGGRTKSLYYKFEKATYSFSLKDEKSVSITITRGTKEQLPPSITGAFSITNPTLFQ